MLADRPFFWGMNSLFFNPEVGHRAVLCMLSLMFCVLGQQGHDSGVIGLLLYPSNVSFGHFTISDSLKAKHECSMNIEVVYTHYRYVGDKNTMEKAPRSSKAVWMRRA